jgi:WXG100 family type VII secretion target
MSVAKVRTDYMQLDGVAKAFGQQAERAQQVLGALANDLSTLQGGDWVGKSADKFYAEMNASVLPAMQRLVAAMTSAGRAGFRVCAAGAWRRWRQIRITIQICQQSS